MVAPINFDLAVRVPAVLPRSPGVLTIRLRGEKTCSNQRIGIAAAAPVVIPSLTG